jgi:hypothetical protein
MNEEKTLTPNSSVEIVSELTPALVKSKLQIALTKTEQSVQGLNDAESRLVYNEDNLDSIKSFIDKCKEAEKVVETERETLKKPYLDGGRTVDAGAKLLSSELLLVRQKAYTQYEKICKEVEKKRAEAEAETLRVKTIRDTMNQFKIDYSVKIADAKTSAELVVLERMINLETANKSRYQELLEEFKTDCTAIRSLLATQKNKVKELEDLEKQGNQAAETGNDGALLEIMEKKESLEAQISENKILVQEKAASQASQVGSFAETVLPNIPKGGRRTWDYEVLDVAALLKKAPHLVDLIANDERIKELLKNKISEGETKGKDEILCFNGLLRYFVKKTY